MAAIIDSRRFPGKQSGKVTDGKEQRVKTMTRSARAGLQFPVGR